MEEAEWMQELELQMKQRTDPWVVLEGQHAVEGAMEGWWDIVGVIAGDHCQWEPPEWSGLIIIRQDRETLEASPAYRFHQGVLGLARQPDEIADVHGLMSELGKDATIVVCPKITDAGDMGSIIRNASAMGADAVILGSEGISPFDPKVVRMSNGALFRIPVRVADSGQILRCLKASGFTLHGASVDAKATSLSELSFDGGRIALVIGAEGVGLGSFWLQACDQKFRIPMASDGDTMNTAALSAVCLWELKQLREAAEDEEAS